MRLAFTLAALLFAGTAGAQWDQAISDKDLLDPWIQAAAMLRALPPESVPAGAPREILASLEQDLSGLRADLENTAISIVGRPEFGYDAAERSLELAGQVGKVEQGMGALFAALGVSDRPDAKAVRDSIASLQNILSGRSRFERDVLNTLGSGSRNAIQALAARWWTAADRVNDVAEAIRTLGAKPP
jgi:hypothetical protein